MEISVGREALSTCLTCPALDKGAELQPIGGVIRIHTKAEHPIVVGLGHEELLEEPGALISFTQMAEEFEG